MRYNDYNAITHAIREIEDVIGSARISGIILRTI